MSWRAKLSDIAERQLKRLPSNIQQRMERAINDLEADPLRGDVLPLNGRQWQGRYRKRVGRYRIIFIVNHRERIVEISTILLRNEQTYHL